MKPNKDIETLTLNYLEGVISKSDLKYLEEWINQNEANQKTFHDYEDAWLAAETTSVVDENLLQNEWEKLSNNIQNKKEDKKVEAKTVSIWTKLGRIAAIFIAGAMVSVGAFSYLQHRQLQMLPDTEISAPFGAKSLVSLPDGSQVWVNAGSKIRYAANYGKKNREIFLEGEAFFDVAKDKSKLFMVKTTDLIVKAYGTSFNVKSYADERTIEATLVEGRIGITRNSVRKKGVDEVVLNPNQRVIFYKESEKYQQKQPIIEADNKTEKRVKPQKLKYIVSKGIDPEMFTSWTEDRLMINSETLASLAVKLERKYDVKIHFKNNDLKKIKFTGTIEKETIEQVLSAIQLSSSIKFEIDESDIWLSKK